ncbi:type II toxin-antitoxin system PemK/MazF family toxin [Pseudomonas sp. R2.Fl]|nr:type II toxin-antitoxin system PemK/MazF family toxin [Pseudomonas sp. R2.Fl]
MAVRGPYAGKPRPVIVMQNSGINLDSVIVVPITTTDGHGFPIRIEIQPNQMNGLKSVSFAMCEKINSVPKAALHSRIGSLPADTLSQIQRTVFDLIDEGED